QLEIGMVAREPPRKALQLVAVVEAAEPPPKARRTDDRAQLPGAIHDRAPDLPELLRVGHIETCRHHQLPLRVDVQVISGTRALPPVGIDGGPEGGLVGSLVLREAHVAVDPVHALARAEPSHSGLEPAHHEDDLLDQVLELGPQHLVLAVMRFEPRLVVVGLEPPEKDDEPLEVHAPPPLTASSPVRRRIPDVERSTAAQPPAVTTTSRRGSSRSAPPAAREAAPEGTPP